MNDQAAHGPAAPKRIRLSLACNQCRKRKVRCDAETPKCRNCVLRGDNCETSDPRRPDGPAVRKWATRDGLFPGEHREHRAGSISERSATSSMMSLQFDPTLANASESTQPAQQQQQNSPGGKQLTWVTRAYMENTNTRDAPSADQMHDSPDVVVNTDESSHRVKVRFHYAVIYMSPSLANSYQSTWAAAVSNASAFSSTFTSVEMARRPCQTSFDGE